MLYIFENYTQNHKSHYGCIKNDDTMKWLVREWSLFISGSPVEIKGYTLI